MYYTLLALFSLSRLFFINSQNVFFDSGENLDLFAYHNYFQAIVSGHFPPHEGYIILFWPVFQAATFLTSHPAFIVVLGQIILAAMVITCFYKIINFITDKKTALIASIIASLLPLFWITNVTIMMETAYTAFFFFSLYFLIRFLQNSKKALFLHLASLCFALSFLSHLLVIIWLPMIMAIIIYKRKDLLLQSLLLFFVYLLAFISLNILFISLVLKIPFVGVISHVYFGKGSEFSYLPFNITGGLIFLRNFLIPLLRNNTSLIVILSFVSLIFLFNKNKQLFIIGLLWILPAAYANQWWDSLLNGRHALIASFGLAFMASYLIRNNKIAVTIITVYLLFVSVPIINLLHQPIPYLTEAEAVKILPQNSLLIETHFAKPQVERTFRGKLLAVNDPTSAKEAIQKEIDTYLAKNIPVFISSGALSEPYGLYSGPYLHNITLSYAKGFELQSVITHYTLRTYKTINVTDNIILYQILSSKPSSYPNILSLTRSSRRLDYYDPITRFVWLWNYNFLKNGKR